MQIISVGSESLWKCLKTTNENVCLAIYDKYDGFGNLKSIQVMGKADIAAGRN